MSSKSLKTVHNAPTHIGGSPVRSIEHLPGRKGWYRVQTEQGKFDIRQDILDRVSRRRVSTVVPDLSQIRGTRQWREAREKQPADHSHNRRRDG